MSRKSVKMATTEESPGGEINHIGDDLLHNILARLPATDFASAACVNHSWNILCDRVLCRPKLASAFSFNSSLRVALKEVLKKVFSEPIRPNFVIASVGPTFDHKLAHRLITEKFGPRIPVVTVVTSGIIGRDAITNKFREFQWELIEDEFFPIDIYGSSNRAIMLTVGFLPGMTVDAIPLFDRKGEPQVAMIDSFVTDIREYTSSISGRMSPAAIIMFGDIDTVMKPVLEKMDYAMSPETVIVGDASCQFLYESVHSTRSSKDYSCVVVALIFTRVREKPPGVGEIQFNAILSSGLAPVGPTFKAGSVREKHYDSTTWLTGRIQGLHANIDGRHALSQIYDDLGNRILYPTFYIGVIKKRKCSIGLDKMGWITYQAFHEVLGDNEEYLLVGDTGIKTGDLFRFYHSDASVALSTSRNVSNQLKRFKQECNNNRSSPSSSVTANRDAKEVFGGLVFSCCGRGESFFGQPNIDSSPLLDNFPGITIAGSFCSGEIGRCDLSSDTQDSEEETPVPVRGSLHVYSSVYLMLSYTPTVG